MDSVLKQLAVDMEGKAVVGLVREKERELFKKFGVKGIPTTIILYNNEVKQSHTGFRDKETLARSLMQYGS
jgi:hypothetical protein